MAHSHDLVQLELDKQHVEQSYNRVRSVVNQASEDYRRCKNHNFARRYGEVRDMIKSCTTDDVLQEYSKSLGRDTEPPDSSRSLLSAARNWTETANKRQNYERILSEVKKLSEGDRQRQFEKTTKELSELKQKFKQVHRMLTTLKGDYNTSKHQIILRRYRDYKYMMKTLIRDQIFD